MKEVRINLNDFVKVKLTDYGKQLYSDLFNEIANKYNLHWKRLEGEVDENGYTKFQLWDFMNIYGEYMTMGNKNVIEPLEIIYRMEDGEE